MRLRIAVGLVMTALSGSASAGAWGSGSFENDDALDFSTNLAQQPDTALVYQTLRGAVRDRTAYLEAPDGATAVAAAEVVAALKGHPCKGMPVALDQGAGGACPGSGPARPRSWVRTERTLGRCHTDRPP